MTQWKIREVRPEDLEAAARVERLCFPAAEAAGKEALRARIQAFPGSFFVAEADGAVVGMINGAVTDEPAIRDEMFADVSLHRPDGAYQSIFGLDVLPEYRRVGIASALTSRLAAEILERGKVPFYCSAWSNIRSVRNGIKSGFIPAWAEMTVKPAKIVEKMNQ